MTEENKSSALKGLAAYRARKQEQERREAERNKPRVQLFSLEKDGDSAIVRFGQEMDPEAKHATDKIGFVNIEHVNPEKDNGWKNRGNCTLESQGNCYPDELVADSSVDWDDRKGWKQKEVFYINVIAGAPREVTVKNQKGNDAVKTFATDIDEKTGDGTVYLLKQGTFNGIYEALSDMATNDETVTEHYYKIRRKGSKYNDTSYIVTKLKEIPKSARALDEFELIDFEETEHNEVPYAQQETFYWRGVQHAASAAEAPVQERPLVGSTSTGTTDGW